MICHMKRMSTSQLQAKVTEAFENLPLEIVRYGKTVGFIVKTLGKREESPQPAKKEDRMGFCQLHFEKGTQYSLKEVYYEDVSGEASPKKMACSECIRKMIGEQKRSGGVLYIDGKRHG